MFTATVVEAATPAPTNSFAEMDSLFRDYNQPGSPGASVMVVRRGKIEFARGYGLADVEAGVPCSTNSNFRLASVTKQFTAMAVMMLYDAKKLKLEETLTDFFPEFPSYGKGIAVRHLLTHTSGLIDYEDVIPPGTMIPVLDQDVLRLLITQDKTYFPPGSQFRYSNSAYSLLSLIVQVRSSMPFAQFLKRRIFEPLKMENTLVYEQGISVVPNRVFGYSLEGTAFKPTDQSLTSSVLGDGGVYSSVAELYKWDQALYTHQLVSAKTQQLIFTPGPPTENPETGYGFGWYIGYYRGARQIWHSGNTRGFTTRITRFPEQQFTVIILANRSDAQLAKLSQRIIDQWLFGDKAEP
jgi:CubicO group peptidase (beta-lactamase class C family)